MKAIGIDKDTLFDLYITKNWTRKEVANYFNCSEVTIKKWISKYNLPKKSNEAHQANVERSNLETYGYKNVFQVPEFKDRKNNTWVENYGSIENRYIVSFEKCKNTCKEKYGFECALQNEDVKNKARLTKLKLYGNPNFTNYEKASKTCLERYGFPNPWCLNTNKRYHYDNMWFDSTWELAMWIYAKDHNEDIEREPVVFTYEYNGKNHHYTPDFRYKNSLIEIKAGWMLDENNNLKAAYKNHDQELLNKKQEIINDNNIIIYTDNNIKPFIDYVNETYSNDYLRSFEYKGGM